MKKEAPPFIWHKRRGKMLSSKFSDVKQAPCGVAKKSSALPLDRTQRFWQNLKEQITKSLAVALVGVMSIGVFGCQPKPRPLPLGIWHRDAVYVNGGLNNERKATLILEKSTFQYFEAGCEMKGIVYYQKEALVLGVQESDCSVAEMGGKIYCGFDLDPDGMTLRLTRDNQFNDSVREVYHLKGAK